MNVKGKAAGTPPCAMGHDEAEAWFVRLLEPDVSEHERAAFERWRAERPEHAAAYSEVERLWQRGAEAVKHPAVMRAAVRALRETRPNPRVRRWLLPAATLAGAAIAAIAILPRWWPIGESPSDTGATTLAATQRTTRLPDGSTVVLDDATVLVERYGARERRVDLVRGWAHFRVQGGLARPFVVHTRGGTVTAVGTEFQVSVGEDETRVILLEGKVAVAGAPRDGTSAPSAVLDAGEEVVFNRSGHVGPARPADLSAVRSWPEGKLFVDDWRLEDLLVEMNRHADLQLRIGDPELRDIRISGIFDAGDQESLILALQQGWPVDAVRVSAHEVVLRHRPVREST